jgi:hypothetical protein
MQSQRLLSMQYPFAIDLILALIHPESGKSQDDRHAWQSQQALLT